MSEFVPAEVAMWRESRELSRLLAVMEAATEPLQFHIARVAAQAASDRLAVASRQLAADQIGELERCLLAEPRHDDEIAPGYVAPTSVLVSAVTAMGGPS